MIWRRGSSSEADIACRVGGQRYNPVFLLGGGDLTSSFLRRWYCIRAALGRLRGSRLFGFPSIRNPDDVHLSSMSRSSEPIFFGGGLPIPTTIRGVTIWVAQPFLTLGGDGNNTYRIASGIYQETTQGTQSSRPLTSPSHSSIISIPDVGFSTHGSCLPTRCHRRCVPGECRKQRMGLLTFVPMSEEVRCAEHFEDGRCA
jgi:hypothetical protein